MRAPYFIDKHQSQSRTESADHHSPICAFARTSRSKIYKIL